MGKIHIWNTRGGNAHIAAKIKRNNDMLLNVNAQIAVLSNDIYEMLYRYWTILVQIYACIIYIYIYYIYKYTVYSGVYIYTRLLF